MSLTSRCCGNVFSIKNRIVLVVGVKIHGKPCVGDYADTHETGFIELYNDWKEDYPNVERFYPVQLHEGCGVARFNIGLRDAQRRLQELSEKTGPCASSPRAAPGCRAGVPDSRCSRDR